MYYTESCIVRIVVVPTYTELRPGRRLAGHGGGGAGDNTREPESMQAAHNGARTKTTHTHTDTQTDRQTHAHTSTHITHTQTAVLIKRPYNYIPVNFPR
jgi:hypothetical protein